VHLRADASYVLRRCFLALFVRYLGIFAMFDPRAAYFVLDAVLVAVDAVAYLRLCGVFAVYVVRASCVVERRRRAGRSAAKARAFDTCLAVACGAIVPAVHLRAALCCRDMLRAIGLIACAVWFCSFCGCYAPVRAMPAGAENEEEKRSIRAAKRGGEEMAAVYQVNMASGLHENERHQLA